MNTSTRFIFLCVVFCTIKARFHCTYPDIGECENEGFGQCKITIENKTAIFDWETVYSAEGCNICGDIFEDFNPNVCALPSCESSICIDNRDKFHFGFTSSMRCDLEEELQFDCSHCDTQCTEVCNLEEMDGDDMIQCLFHFEEVGKADPPGLCGKNVPQTLCNDDDVTCVGLFQLGDLGADVDIDKNKCVLVFTEEEEDQKRSVIAPHFWVCDKKELMSSTFQDDAPIFTTPYCDIFASHYGENLFQQNGETSASNSLRLFSWTFSFL